MKRATDATVFGCAAVLLSYPGEDFAGDLAAVAEAVTRLPRGSVRTALGTAAGWLSAMSATEAAATYVDTFDLNRGTSLYLTYYRHGDTRERGLALAALVDGYRSAGFAPAPGELPDFLPAMLELAAVHSSGAALLSEQRAGVDALQVALAKDDSPFAGVVAAVADTLPSPSRADKEVVARYRAQGPPSEQVGLEPFAPPEVIGGGQTTDMAGRR